MGYMENIVIAVGGVAAVVAFEVAAWFFGSDSRQVPPHKNQDPELGPGHRPTWF